MSESEEFELLKVIELGKHGLDITERPSNLNARLSEAAHNGTEVDGAPFHSSVSNEEKYAATVGRDDASSSPSTMGDDQDHKQTSTEANLKIIEDLSLEGQEKDESLSNKKRSLHDEAEVKDNSMEQQDDDDENHNSDDTSKQKRMKRSRWGTEQNEDFPGKHSNAKQTSDDDDEDDDNSSSRRRERDYDQDYHRSSRQRDDDRHYASRHSDKPADREMPLPEEETVQFNNDDVVLDFYTADLNLTINTDCLSASNKSNDALCFLWAGARTTYGFKQGKICYEIKITEITDCPQMPESEKEKFGIALGWSNLSSNLQTGESNDSFTYASTGKKLSKTNDIFTEEAYGDSFGLSDVLACYIDLSENTEESLVRISFGKNGESYGQAFELPRSNSSDFYPYILVKNVQFQCNFGQLENSWSTIQSDYTFAQNIPLADRTRCSVPMLDKSDCDVLLLSGLNGSGKTTWAKKYIEQNPTKNFNLLNIEHVLSKMTIDGKLPVVRDRNDGLMLRANVALQKVIEVAAQRRRNFIIDHVNTTRESQSKRQRLFTGYHRIGVVLVPDDDELKRRMEKTENISLSSQWIKEMKAKFSFPQKSSVLEDVIYPELSYEEGKALYDRVRRDYDQHRSSSRYDRHDDYRSSYSDSRSRYDDRRSRDEDRYTRSRSRERDRERRGPRDDSRFSSSSQRNDSSRGGYFRGENNRYSDHRQDSRSNQGGNHHEGYSSYRGRGGGGGSGGYNNQSNEERRGGYYQQQQSRNDFSGGRGRGGFDNNRNQFNNRGSFQDNQRGSGFRQDFNSQQRGRPFNNYDNNQQQQSDGKRFTQNSHSFNPSSDRQNFGSRPPMLQQQQQQPYPFHNQPQQQQRSQPLLQTPSSNPQQPNSFPSQLIQQATNHFTTSLQPQNSLNVNSLANTGNASQQNSLDSWLALYAAALNPQPTVTQQPQQDANTLTQQWAQWLKSAQLAQVAQQIQPKLNIQQTEPQQQQQQTQVSDANALYYQAYYAQLAAAQQQAAAGSTHSGGAPSNGGGK